MTVYMITLNDYLYSGDTLLRILHNYSEDLRKDARKNKNEIDLAHCNFRCRSQNFWSIMISLRHSRRKFVNFINIWHMNTHSLPLPSRGESNP